MNTELVEAIRRFKDEMKSVNHVELERIIVKIFDRTYSVNPHEQTFIEIADHTGKPVKDGTERSFR
ncbi:hypothetical protein [Klebsiella pneumoniae]|uniref:hypothetical protein n=1 Tax=Klebsiella pneumoniae TaxID=573 RepID=UPI000E3E91E8|nr:hypothetical protein [Klebsiella pneumoniae]